MTDRPEVVPAGVACGRRGCSDQWTAMPTLELWHAPGSSYAPARLELGIGFCEVHAIRMTPADLLSAEGKEQIEAVFRLRGKAAPDWATARLTWRRRS